MVSLKNRKEGFTIVELLIVIVVIGILALLVITTYSGIQQKARNSKRTSDLKSLQTHLEAYFQENGNYPSRTQMNTDAFLTASMKSLDTNAKADPKSGGNKTLGATVADNQYAYAPLNTSNASCEADATTCVKYTMTANYEGEVNGEEQAVVRNLDGE